jgi:hypothetical protein
VTCDGIRLADAEWVSGPTPSSARTDPRERLPPGPMPDLAPGDVRTPPEAGLCAVCRRPLTGRRPQRVCSPRCRVAYWRALRAQETATTLARLLAENAALRQYVGELERLVGQLKRRLWPQA